MQALLNAIHAMDLPTDACRLFHGRGGLHPGCEQWALDYFAPVWLLTRFQPASDAELAAVDAALSSRWQQLLSKCCLPTLLIPPRGGGGNAALGALSAGQPLNWVYQCRHEGRSSTRQMAGSVPQPHVVSEDGAHYLVHLQSGQNHGLFLDMAEGRRWVRRQLAARPRAKVLNLFAYTCAFSVVALQAGARQVVNLDMSPGALAIGQQNHRLNGLAAGASFLPHDLFNTWGKLSRGGPYDLVIVDPPSYQKGSFVATKDYPRLMRRLPGLLAPGGQALLCLNAPELGPGFLQDAMREAAPDLAFVQRLPNPAAFADVSAERSLKVLVYQAPA